MATEAQVSANRSNAQKSTGPRTPEGKAAVAQNAVTHGLLARAAVLHGEDWEEYTRFHEEMRDELYPDGMLEEELAERIVDLSWRLRRVRRYQTAVFEALYDRYAAQAAEPDDRAEPIPAVPSDAVLGRMLLADFSGERVLERVLLYERRIESSLSRARTDLRNLKKERRTEERRKEDQKVRGWDRHGVLPSFVPAFFPSSVPSFPGGVDANTPDAQGQFGETKPICRDADGSPRSHRDHREDPEPMAEPVPASALCPPRLCGEDSCETKPIAAGKEATASSVRKKGYEASARQKGLGETKPISRAGSAATGLESAGYADETAAGRAFRFRLTDGGSTFSIRLAHELARRGQSVHESRITNEEKESACKPSSRRRFPAPSRCGAKSAISTTSAISC